MPPLRSSPACAPAENLQPSRGKSRSRNAHRARLKRFPVWHLGSWNVRSLVDCEGPVETARQSATAEGEDRRIDLVIRELGRYQVVAAGLQETKWFGNAMYKVGESVVLTAGRPTPQAGQPRQRGEGVAIILSGPAVAAWKRGGEVWKAWSSRLVTATLQLGQTSADRLHLLSCYAPTFAASRVEKDYFLNDLQQALDTIPPSESYVILGDFNARVGSRSSEDDWCVNVRGPHGLAEANDAGKELLSFLGLNEATICNTWFVKKDIHKSTWQHPKSKKWHCIDFAIMRQKDRARCIDAAVKRGAECNTDHQLLRIKVKVVGGRFYHKPRSNPPKKFDVSALRNSTTNDIDTNNPRNLFQDRLNTTTQAAWKVNSTVEEKWSTLKRSLIEAALETLGSEQRRQPDWLRDSAEILEPLFQQRNNWYAKWLSSGSSGDKEKFARARRDARRAVRNAKNAWFLRKAQKAQRGRFEGKEVWQCIRDMQHACRGLVPVRSGTIKDELGNPCTSAEEREQRWRRHFTGVLNQQSQFNAEELERVVQRPLRPHLAELPSEEELVGAVNNLKNGKAGGESGILPEMVKAGCQRDEFRALLLDLVHTVWREKRVPQEWANSVLVPVPKKGDLSSCDNWRGISLLDVVGKVVARILQDRLQHLAEEELPESQCGFRKERGCSDMIFAVRQLVEKSWEHRAKLYFLFIDLRKAYDSVPRAAMWQALGKLGVPDTIIELIRSFHQGTQAKLRVNGALLDEIDVTNGLRQGCCMAPVLFNLYACLLVERWTARIQQSDGIGVQLRYKHDRKLFRRYTRNAEETRLNELQFADDAALLATTRSGAEKALQEYSHVAADFGLTVSMPKTKLMVSGREATEVDKAPIRVGEEEVGNVSQFTYLGSVITSSGRVELDVNRRVAQASKAFGALRKAVFGNKDLRVETKRAVYQACILSVLLYGSECWTPLKRDLRRLNSFHHRCIRSILGMSRRQQWTQHVTSGELRQRWGDPETVAEKVAQRRLEWLGHVARMPDERTPKISLFSWLQQPRPQGGPRKRWRDTIHKDLRDMGISEDAWYKEATSSRTGWRALYRAHFVEEATRDDHHRMTGAEHPTWQVQCPQCKRCFRREGDKKRHKCLAERQKPIPEQRGAVQCSTCSKWFRSQGGFAVHHCRPSPH